MRTKPLPRVIWLLLLILAIPAASSATIVLSIGFAPPPLPIYDQPLCPGAGFIWIPGYWAYDDVDGYFWVPGTWVLAPEPGFLWTPGYWGWSGGVFVFNQGYWGPHVGFYGGINYGFGYIGVGYEGGYWSNGAFFYNRAVNNVTNVTNVYNKTVVVNNVTTVSYNGGTGGITARPTAAEEAAAQERHVPPTAAQTQHVQAASTNRQLYESMNHGKPAIAATARPGEFSGGVVAARAAAPSYRPPSARTPSPGAPAAGTHGSANAIHPNELPPLERANPNTGNPKQDQKFQQRQEQLRSKQEQEQQKLQQKQEQEHQSLAKQNANAAQKDKLEQKHQQETQQLARRQAQEQQKFQQTLPKPKH